MERSSSYNAMTTIALLEIERILPAAHFDSQGLRTAVKSTFAQRQNGFKPFLMEQTVWSVNDGLYGNLWKPPEYEYIMYNKD